MNRRRKKVSTRKFNSKSEDFKKLVFNFHTEDTNRIYVIVGVEVGVDDGTSSGSNPTKY